MKGTDSSKSTQCEKILAHLSAGRAITPLEALNDYGCMRLGARIYDLRAMGYQIDQKMIEVVNRDGQTCKVASYNMPRQMTLDAQADYESFRDTYADRGCTCFQSAPCSYCAHTGNPANIEEDSASWVGGKHE